MEHSLVKIKDEHKLSFVQGSKQAKARGEEGRKETAPVFLRVPPKSRRQVKCSACSRGNPTKKWGIPWKHGVEKTYRLLAPFPSSIVAIRRWRCLRNLALIHLTRYLVVRGFVGLYISRKKRDRKFATGRRLVRRASSFFFFFSFSFLRFPFFFFTPVMTCDEQAMMGRKNGNEGQVLEKGKKV